MKRGKMSRYLSNYLFSRVKSFVIRVSFSIQTQRSEIHTNGNPRKPTKQSDYQNQTDQSVYLTCIEIESQLGGVGWIGNGVGCVSILPAK